jgi:hypothetical protein
MKPLAFAAIAALLFVAGRHAHPRPAPATPVSPLAVDPDNPPPMPGSSAARRVAMQALLKHLEAAPAVVASPGVQRSVTEPPDITAKRRQRVNAEIDQRAPNLPATKRTVLVAEADRLAWDKRQLRAAFLDGSLSEADYVAALKDDIRAALADFEETLSADEYVALFNRRPGSDPFTMESLVGRPPETDR